MKKSVKTVFWIYTLLFLIVIGNLIKISVFDRDKIINNPYNPRISSTSQKIMRGSILDAKERPIVQTVKVDNENDPLGRGFSYVRQYSYPRAFAHITGYTAQGKTGAESEYNYILESVSNELYQNLNNVISKKDIKGNDIVLTIDADLQNYAAEQLGTSKGAVVALEPETGKILTMVSYPNFDPNTVSENWTALNSDTENSPLMSRAAQGLYPPGSTFKIITATAALETDSSLINYEKICYGEEDFGGKLMHCYNSEEHGREDMNSAFAESCNTYFADIGMQIGAKKLRETAQKFFIDPNFPLEYSKPVFSLTEESPTHELVDTAIGQGKTLVSPLFMAMVAGTIANNGIMMQPYILDHSINNFGLKTNKTIPTELAQIMPPSEAEKIAGLMKQVVEYGTATDADFYIESDEEYEYEYDYVESDSGISASSVKAVPKEPNGKITGYISVAGKTGTAENSGGADHAWFVAFAPADDPKIAVAVLLENAGKGSKAIPVARNVMKYYLTNCYE
ncbi:MAG: hypothetical protein IJR45_02845 [Firmicutes bacterium]|nr:hypothetical protein [Bacillota bacterium]